MPLAIRNVAVRGCVSSSFDLLLSAYSNIMQDLTPTERKQQFRACTGSGAASVSNKRLILLNGWQGVQCSEANIRALAGWLTCWVRQDV